jgi:ribosomal RNA-processing protein 9
MTIDQCISVGARDRTARLWKVVEEAQLIFRGGSSRNTYQENNIDCIAPLPPTHFVTGSDNGSISLWSIHKKKPLYTIPHAHGLDPIPSLEEHSPETDRQTAESNARFLRRMPRWITALTTVPGTDIVLSGSWDGWIRAWKVSDDKRTIHPLGPVSGGPVSQAPDTPSKQLEQSLASADGSHRHPAEEEIEPLVKGVVNGISVFERRVEATKPGQVPSDSKKSKSTSSTAPGPRGLCIAVAIGKEHRLGRWKCYGNNYFKGATAEGRNGAMIFEVPFLSNKQGRGEKEAL